MVPKVVEFHNSGNEKNLSNQAWSLVKNFESVATPEATFGPNLLAVIPMPEEPLVFDPPPMAA